MAESTTSERRMAAVPKQLEAMRMRMAGVPFPEIARKLGYAGPSGAYQAVMAGLQVTLKPAADELRALESARYNEIWKDLWAEYLTVKDGKRVLDLETRLKVSAELRRWAERRAKLEGLDKPTTVKILKRAVDDFTEDDLIAIATGEIEGLVDESTTYANDDASGSGEAVTPTETSEVDSEQSPEEGPIPD